MISPLGGLGASRGATEIGVLTGAGISAGLPAGLPLGRAFHRLLRDACESSARSFAPDVVDDAVIEAVGRGSWNWLARIEQTMPGSARGALEAMRVDVPNEEHLLAAIHLARGGYHVTLNFDDGVEVAYALLKGERALPAGSASFEVTEALRAWRRAFPHVAPSLRVVSGFAAFAARSFRSRPLLVKLHGSVVSPAESLASGVVEATEDPEIVDLGAERRLALDELSRHQFVLVTGFSGGDPASALPVIARLHRTRFAWVAPEIRPRVRDAIETIDPSQPHLGLATDAFRELLGVAVPAWPLVASPPAFEERIGRWLEALPVTVAVEAFAWSLLDCGLLDEATELLARVAREDGRVRTRLRLSDAVARRRRRGGRWVAQRQLGQLLAHGDSDVRRCAAIHWAEHMIGAADPTRRGSPALAAGLAAATVALAAGGDDAPGARARPTVVLATVVLDRIERELPRALRSRPRRAILRVATARTLRAVRRALAESASAPSGRRRLHLRRQAVELRVIRAMIRGRPPPRISDAAFAELAEAFAHLSDGRGIADTTATQALVYACRGDGRAEVILLDARGSGASPSLTDMVARVSRHAERIDVQSGASVSSVGTSSTIASATSSSAPSSTSSSAP